MHSIESHPDHHSLDDVLRDPSLKEAYLKHAIDVVTENFKSSTPLSPADRELVKNAEEVDATISGRSALIFEDVVTDYVKRLEKENRELRQALNDGSAPNTAEAGRTIENNERRLRTIRENCLGSLTRTTDQILFRRAH